MAPSRMSIRASCSDLAAVVLMSASKLPSKMI
jgi:hypothetical protein